mmetsp:Transcript_42219/g.103113  ORF Transcript_42219/g.103113 Transcript_42219/m.103113 type:complete len:263 (+) Transcript_42219:2370-3158(+)
MFINSLVLQHRPLLLRKIIFTWLMPWSPHLYVFLVCMNVDQGVLLGRRRDPARPDLRPHGVLCGRLLPQPRSRCCPSSGRLHLLQLGLVLRLLRFCRSLLRSRLRLCNALCLQKALGTLLHKRRLPPHPFHLLLKGRQNQICIDWPLDFSRCNHDESRRTVLVGVAWCDACVREVYRSLAVRENNCALVRPAWKQVESSNRVRVGRLAPEPQRAPSIDPVNTVPPCPSPVCDCGLSLDDLKPHSWLMLVPVLPLVSACLIEA